MAGLVEGQQYGLSAQDKINCTKSLVFVKLTDSAIRSIEEYVKNKGQYGPTIQFQNSTGVISLPQNGSNQTYGFTLSNVEADGPHGSFECLRQTGHGHKSLESLGCMQLKMHIHATEESYENTRVKMASIEKEQKKSCTKVIKPAGAHLGRKVKVKRPVQMVSPLKSSPPAAAMLSKPPPKPPVMPNLPPKKPEPPHRPKPPPKNPELVRQPIRDRIIHLLAVRPYKRPELLVRLANDGIREKDKNTLSSILPQLSVLKGNIYYLNKGCWKEVQENWKFCTQEELEIIRKRKQQNEATTDKVEHDPPAPSPQNNVFPPQKRVLSEVETNGHPRNKKQRISHYKGDQQQPQPPPAPPQRNGIHPPPPSDISSSTPQQQQPQPPTNKRPRHSPAHEELLHRSPAYPSPTEKPPPKPRPPARPRLPPPEKNGRLPPAAFNGTANSRPSKVSSTTNGSCSASPHSSSDSRDSMEYNDGLQVPPPTESPTQCDSPEYEKEYCRIESDEQRARYKANFNAEYQEYLYLHEKIISISKKFASLEKHLRTCDEGSEDFVKIKGKIIKEYRAYQQDPGYLGALKKFNYLHTKLAYIKRLVTEYDTAQCTKS